MVYGKLGSPSRHDQSEKDTTMLSSASSSSPTFRRRNKLLLFSLLAVSLIVASAVSAAVFFGTRSKAGGDGARSGPYVHRQPTQAISKTCGKTRYPTLCVDSLLDFPGSLSASEPDLVHISFNVTLQRFGKALYTSSEIANFEMDARVRSAYEDCLELLDDSVDALSRSLVSVAPPPSGGGGTGGKQGAGSTQDVRTWLSAALTNHDTCTDGFGDVSGYVKDQMVSKLKDLSELVSNCLAIYAATDGDDFSGVPIQNKRRRLMGDDNHDVMTDISGENIGYPKWMSRRERRLLDMPVSGIQADIVVSKDGNGTYKTIAEAIKKAPEYSSRRTIIYVRAGR